jgi:hypothetical protein
MLIVGIDFYQVIIAININLYLGVNLKKIFFNYCQNNYQFSLLTKVLLDSVNVIILKMLMHIHPVR